MTKSPDQPWFVYLLRCADGSLYTGITTNLNRRLEEHNSQSPKGARYTRARQPVSLAYHEPARNRSEASKREYEIKRMTKNKKLGLIDRR